MSQPDLLLYNSRVHTMDPDNPTATALAIRGERIAALDDGDELRSALDRGAEAVNLRGSTVIPGLIDAHIHFAEYSLRLNRVNIYELPTKQETLRRIATRARGAKPGEWIRGGGWNRNLWEDGTFPHRWDLDRISPHVPVALSSKDGHSLWVNTKAMELAGISAQTPNPSGGNIRRDPSGEPTGILQENAIDLVFHVIPYPTPEEMIAACKQGMANAHRVGLTSIHDCEGDQALGVFQELHRQGELTIRVLMHIPEENLDAAIALGLRDGFGDEWLRVGGVKAFADGALGSRSAWMLTPYEDEPKYRGIPTATSSSLRALVRRANNAGLSAAIHAIGDAANRAVLDAVEASPAILPMRNRIEHVQLLHPDDIPRLGQIGVIASMQPIHATSDIEIADLHWGPRAATSYAWRSLLDSGARLAFGSDAPVEDLSPLLGIHAAVCRRRLDGFPDPDGWYPEQAITPAEAVHAYTVGAAYASGEAHFKGSLAPGKLADLVILDQDIFEIDPMDIPNTQVLGTMVGGKFAYRGSEL